MKSERCRGRLEATRLCFLAFETSGWIVSCSCAWRSLLFDVASEYRFALALHVAGRLEVCAKEAEPVDEQP